MLSQTKPKKKKRNNILFFITLILVIIGLAYTAYYKMYSQFYETTDNAYVKQNITYVTPQINGVVDKVNVDVTQVVKVGDILAHLDSKDAMIAFKKAKNNLAQSVRQIKKSYRQKDEIKSEIKFNKVLLQKAKEDYDRSVVLIKHKAISREKFDNIKYAYDEAKERLQITKNQYNSLLATIRDKIITQNPVIKKAVLEVKESYINLKRCNILAPISGVIAKKNLSVGSSVSPGSMLVAIVPQKGFWVDANFKETQIKNIRVDQKVKLYADVYGKNILYHGRVEGISPGTGSVFSLLPAQNATGNWIKVVQRVPIRIKLDEKELQKHPLQVGNSMVVTIDTHDRGNKKMQTIKKPQYSSNLYSKALIEAKKIANEVIKQNL